MSKELEFVIQMLKQIKDNKIVENAIPVLEVALLELENHDKMNLKSKVLELQSLFKVAKWMYNPVTMKNGGFLQFKKVLSVSHQEHLVFEVETTSFIKVFKYLENPLGNEDDFITPNISLIPLTKEDVILCYHMNVILSVAPLEQVKGVLETILKEEGFYEEK